MGKNTQKKRWRMNVLSCCLSVFKGVASGTLFSCQRQFIFSFPHLAFFLSLQKQKQPLGTADVFLRKDAALMLWNCIKALAIQNIKTPLFSLGTGFFVKQAPSKYIHHGICTNISAPCPFSIAFAPHSSKSFLFTTLPTSCTGTLPFGPCCLLQLKNPFLCLSSAFGFSICITPFLENPLFSQQRGNQPSMVRPFIQLKGELLWKGPLNVI